MTYGSSSKLCGGGGEDTRQGEGGNDRLYGNADDDFVNGGAGNEGRMAVNGMTVGAARSGGVSSYVYDSVGVDEVAVLVPVHPRAGEACRRCVDGHVVDRRSKSHRVGTGADRRVGVAEGGVEGDAVLVVDGEEALLVERHRAGRIVEGHGDLRPEHICLEREPVVIDCLEFSRRLRLADPAEEMAFLALECAMLGEPDAGVRLQRSYETITGDRPPEPLIAWYAGCHALIRARLMALHSLEPGARPPEAWLAKSNRYLDIGSAYADAEALA